MPLIVSPVQFFEGWLIKSSIFFSSRPHSGAPWLYFPLLPMAHLPLSAFSGLRTVHLKLLEVFSKNVHCLHLYDMYCTYERRGKIMFKWVVCGDSSVIHVIFAFFQFLLHYKV